MTIKERYESAKEIYAKIGVDTDKAIETLKNVPVSMHCWQGDDVIGFDQKGPLTGGIQTTGNYPGKASTPEELMADLDEALKLIPGKKKINVHASYAIFEDGEWADRDALEPKHFRKWVEFAKENDAHLIIRGLRAVTDFESEMQIAQTNHSIEPDIDTMFFTTSLEYAFLSSTIVKEVAFYGADISKFVPPGVIRAFEQKKQAINGQQM